MARSKSNSLPKFSSLEELVEFFDTHDMGEYWDSMPEAHFEINIKGRTHLFALDEDLAERLTAIAKAKHVPSERLINTWLKEKLFEQG
ncbi:MAG: CopG family antitoxin [Anaerolineae bacterium]